jgi:predicted esterase
VQIEQCKLVLLHGTGGGESDLMELGCLVSRWQLTSVFDAVLL